jgi:hypothetical protein
VQLPALAAAEKQNAAAAKADGDEVQSLVATKDEIYYRGKAMYVWWMLRDLIGDKPLQAAIKSYRPAEDKDSTYLQHLVTAQTKRDLQWFFDNWVYRDRGLADFTPVAIVPRETVNNAYLVALTVENAGGAPAEVPITLTSTGGEQTVRLQVPAHQKITTRVAVTGKPTNIEINDGSVPESNLANNKVELK